ncbi:MAG: TIGR03960 family B12-binding radical SAM protein [Selenomonadaceae bacterium]|nr:TIGR03960 family B12-binding radical SAM protein [Selenomonadaceae bacterium]
MDWELKEELKARLKKEQGYYVYPTGGRQRFALVYPNSYHVGMSNLGIHIIYELLNKRKDTACERFFLPERKQVEAYRKTRTPLLSMETQSPLFRFSIIGFAASFEMDYFHILEMLELGKVCLRAAERGEMDPIVIIGGPCATFNPEPLSLFADAFVVGEGEAVLPHFMDVYCESRSEGLARPELLRRLSEVPGIYVPSLYEHCYDEAGVLREIKALQGAPANVERQWVKNLDEHPAHTVVVTENTEFNLYLIETARGCGRHCRFCMAGYCFRRPRNRSLSFLGQEVRDAVPYGKRIGLMGAAISDYPEIDALCEDISRKGLPMSVASFRADSVTERLVESLARGGLRTLTMAPEAGSRRMRAAINKGIEEEHLFAAMEMGLKAGIQNFRLYLMIGLPFEEEEDIDAIVELAGRLKDFMEERGSKGTLTLSINPFIPKPFTPFQWMPMADRKRLEKRLRKIQDALKKRKHIHIIAESIKEACIQGILARGDRRISEVLLASHVSGGIKSFRRAMGEAGLSSGFYLQRERSEQEIFPWDSLSMGFRRDYLYKELKKAETFQPTPQCFDGCRRCGVCYTEER